MTAQVAYGVVAAVWAVPALVAIPSASMASVLTYPRGEGGGLKTFCAQIWPAERRAAYRAYFLLVFALEFVGPVAVMAACYARISRRLWSAAAPGAQTAGGWRRLRRRRRTVVALVLVLAAYVLCWAPYYSFALIRDFSPALLTRHRNALVAFYLVECVAMGNGVINTLCFVGVRGGCRRPRRSLVAPPVKMDAFVVARATKEDGACTSSLRVTEVGGQTPAGRR